LRYEVELVPAGPAPQVKSPVHGHDGGEFVPGKGRTTVVNAE